MSPPPPSGRRRYGLQDATTSLATRNAGRNRKEFMEVGDWNNHGGCCHRRIWTRTKRYHWIVGLVDPCVSFGLEYPNGIPNEVGKGREGVISPDSHAAFMSRSRAKFDWLRGWNFERFTEGDFGKIWGRMYFKGRT